MRVSVYLDVDMQEKCISKSFFNKYSHVLDDRQKEVVSLRLGHFDGCIWSYEEIGENVGSNRFKKSTISRQRVAQIYRKALRLIRKETLRQSQADSEAGTER